MTMTQGNKLHVEAICSGTVIDHIPTQVGIKLFSLFKLTAYERITIGLNLPSNQHGKKDILKLENVFVTEEQTNRMAVYAPHATVNHIINYNVVRKQTLPLPERVDGILCLNSNCISRSEPVASGFTVKVRDQQVYLQCKCCEKEFEHRAVIHGT